MWDDEQGLGEALRTELVERTSPPARGGVAEVVGRGRRRRRAQQVGATLAVVVAIGGTVVAAGVLSRSNALPPANTVTTAPSPDAAWPRADLPAHTPYTTWTPGASASPSAGRPVEAVPQCDIGDTFDRNVNTVPAGADLQRRLVDAMRVVATGATVGQLVEQHLSPSRPGSVDAYVYRADITDGGGTGSVEFSIGAFTGDPLAAADEQAFDEFNCDPPKREVLADGTVLQVYRWQPSEPFQSLTQVLRIYLPDGQLYTLTVRNFGSPDFAPNPVQPEVPNRVGAGRASLPLTEAQLADLGLAIVTD
jgi:hypothetical protein